MDDSQHCAVPVPQPWEQECLEERFISASRLLLPTASIRGVLRSRPTQWLQALGEAALLVCAMRRKIGGKAYPCDLFDCCQLLCSSPFEQDGAAQLGAAAPEAHQRPRTQRLRRRVAALQTALPAGRIPAPLSRIPIPGQQKAIGLFVQAVARLFTFLAKHFWLCST